MNKAGFVSAYYDFSFTILGPRYGGKLPTEEGAKTADFKLDVDVSELAPYINAVAQKPLYYEKPCFIRFLLDGFGCTLYRNIGWAGTFSDRNQALEFLERLIAFLNDLYFRKDSIQPSHKTYQPVSVPNILRLLPRTNCGRCGFATCMAFAAALSRNKVFPHQCPGFSAPMSVRADYPLFDDKGKFLMTVSIDLDKTVVEPGVQFYSKTGSERLETRRKITGPARPGPAFWAASSDALPAPLTARELSVLRLVARGATNVEISDLLQISPHTVKAHVVHIFNKIGVNDRTQAAVWAARLSLV